MQALNRLLRRLSERPSWVLAGLVLVHAIITLLVYPMGIAGRAVPAFWAIKTLGSVVYCQTAICALWLACGSGAWFKRLVPCLLIWLLFAIGRAVALVGRNATFVVAQLKSEALVFVLFSACFYVVPYRLSPGLRDSSKADDLDAPNDSFHWSEIAESACCVLALLVASDILQAWAREALPQVWRYLAIYFATMPIHICALPASVIGALILNRRRYLAIGTKMVVATIVVCVFAEASCADLDGPVLSLRGQDVVRAVSHSLGALLGGFLTALTLRWAGYRLTRAYPAD